ncbi:VRR-NUC domain protein [compost metagenome]
MKKANQSSLDHVRYRLEATLTSKVKDWLDCQGDIFYWKASDRYTKGVSDLILCVNGWFVGVELKADDGAPSQQQNLFIKQVVRMNGIAGVCFTLGDVKALVDQARQRTVYNGEVRQGTSTFPSNTGKDG